MGCRPILMGNEVDKVWERDGREIYLALFTRFCVFFIEKYKVGSIARL